MKWTGISKMTEDDPSGNSSSDQIGNYRLAEQDITRKLSTSSVPVQNKLRRQRTHNWGDMEHVQAHLSTSLEYLARRYKELSAEVHLWFQTSCLKDCILRHSGNPVGLEKALLSLVDHAYGIHEKCGLCCKDDGDADVSKAQTFQPFLSDARLQHKLNDLFRKLAEKSEEIARGSSTLTGNLQMLNVTEFSSTVSSCAKKDLGCDNSCVDLGKRSERNISKNELMGLSESVECETGVRREEEQPIKNNNLVQLSETVECKKRRTSATREEQVTRKFLDQHSGSSENARHGGVSREEGTEHMSCKEVIEFTERAECEKVGTTGSSESQGLVTSKDLTGFSSSGTLFDHKQELVYKSLQHLSETYNELTSEVLLWLQTTCFNVYVQRYKDPAGLKRVLLSIIDHAYGAHENCGAWCEYNGNFKTPKPTPFQPMLSDQCLKSKLSNLFGKLTEKQKSVARRSLVKIIQSSTNTSFSKAYKTKYHVNPQPLRNRWKKTRYAFLFNENTSNHASPAKSARLYHASKSKARTTGSDHIEKDEEPKRKFIKEKPQVAQCLSSENGDGSPCDLKAPSWMVKPPVQCFVVELPTTMVFFDLETTSLAKDCEIVQLAAICGEKTFDRYILPRSGISPGASRVTGLTVSKGVLYLHHRPLNVIPLRQALVEFLSWLKGLGQCLLVGHNSKSFDAPRLFLQLEKNGLAKTLCDTVLGFLDTLPYFRESKPHLANHRQETLAKQLLKVNYNAHRALDDVKILQRLVIQFADHAALAKHGFSASWAYESMRYDLQKQKNRATFAVLEEKELLSKGLCEKMAASGLREHDLRAAYAQAVSQGVQGRDGIIKLLTEKGADGKVRVTSQKKVLERLVAFYDEMISGSVTLQET